MTNKRSVRVSGWDTCPKSLRRAVGVRFRFARPPRLTGNPGRGSLIFSAVSNPAVFPAGNKLENYLPATVQARSSVILGGGEHQPMPFQDFVGSVLVEDLVTAIRIHLQGRSRAAVRLPRYFHADASISAREGSLCSRWRAHSEAQDTEEENFGEGAYEPQMLWHS